MPAHRKSLEQLVQEGTFRARHHRDRLDEGPLLRWTTLARIQERYRTTAHPLDRRQLALAFQHAVARLLERRRRALRRPSPNGRGRPAKTLAAHVAEGTFKPSRHAHLLAPGVAAWRIGEPPPELDLDDFRRRWRRARSDHERHAVALDFRDAALPFRRRRRR